MFHIALGQYKINLQTNLKDTDIIAIKIIKFNSKFKSGYKKVKTMTILDIA